MKGRRSGRKSNIHKGIEGRWSWGKSKIPQGDRVSGVKWNSWSALGLSLGMGKGGVIVKKYSVAISSREDYRKTYTLSHMQLSILYVVHVGFVSDLRLAGHQVQNLLEISYLLEVSQENTCRFWILDLDSRDIKLHSTPPRTNMPDGDPKSE